MKVKIMLKKAIPILSLACFSFSLLVNNVNHVYAIGEEYTSQEVVLYESAENVYDAIIKQTDGKEFSMNSLEQQEVSKSINDLKNSIYELKAKPVEELKSIGYEGEQLYSIMNYDGSVAMTRSSLPVVRSNVSGTIFGKNYTVTASFRYDGTYVGYLYVKNNYGIATVPKQNGNAVTPNPPSSCTGSINYNYYVNGVKNTTTSSNYAISRSKGAVIYSFPVGINVSGTRGYVTSGTFKMTCSADSVFNVVQGTSDYGYVTSDSNQDFLMNAGGLAYSIFTNDYVGAILTFLKVGNDTVLLGGAYYEFS